MQKGRKTLVHRKPTRKSKGYLLPGEGERTDKVRLQKEIGQGRGAHSLETRERERSGHGKKVTKRGELTTWIPQRGETSQDMERKPLGERHSLSIDRRRDKSGHRKKVTSERNSLSRDHRGRDKSGHRKKPTE